MLCKQLLSLALLFGIVAQCEAQRFPRRVKYCGPPTYRVYCPPPCYPVYCPPGRPVYMGYGSCGYAPTTWYGYVPKSVRAAPPAVIGSTPVPPMPGTAAKPGLPVAPPSPEKSVMEKPPLPPPVAESVPADPATAETTPPIPSMPERSDVPPVVPPLPAERDLITTAKALGKFGKLLEAAGKAQLLEEVGEGPYTIFAPTDAAFANLDADLAQRLNSDEALLRDVLLYHAVAGQFPAAELVAKKSVASVGGALLQIEETAEGVLVNGARVATADVRCTDGVIHIIDKVLLPPNLKLAEQPDAPAPVDN